MRWKVLALLTWIGGALGVGVADAKPPETYPLEKVRPGQKGYGLTTFQGSTPDRFEFEVVGVLKNFLPKMDLILVKSDDEKVQVSGFWQGMSGSPLYLDGKLLCAFSYGFRFNKLPIGGCTPIEYMKSEGFQKPRRAKFETGPARRSSAGRPKIVRASGVTGDDWRERFPNGSIDAFMRRPPPGDKTWRRLVRGPTSFALDTNHQSGLAPAAIPLALAGITGPAFAEVREIFSDYPFEPMQGGGTGRKNTGPRKFQMGGPIAVQLIRGDMAAAGTGTVSYIDGNRVLAFGHPMFQVGEIYAPVATAEVHTVIPSAMSAFVLASPLREIGTLLQDRQSTIAANTSLRTRMIPVNVRVRESGKSPEIFRAEVLSDRFFTSTLASVVAMNAATLYLPDRDRMTVKMLSRIVMRGHGDVSFVDYLYSPGGALGLVGAARGLRALVPLLTNPFESVEIERIELDIQADYKSNFGEIVSLRLPTRELAAGKRSHVWVEMTTFDGKRISEKVPFNVPGRLAGSIVKLEVTAGDAAQLDAAPPESLKDLISALRKLLPGDAFAVTLHSADEGVAVRGKLIRDLPASVADKLKVSSSTTPYQVYRPLYRSVSKSKRVINGKKSLLVKVAAER